MDLRVSRIHIGVLDFLLLAGLSYNNYRLELDGHKITPFLLPYFTVVLLLYICGAGTSSSAPLNFNGPGAFSFFIFTYFGY